ncbi:hypothetical protein LQF76_09310 [Gloeomargaritales cyanobacterium VI4D9]|nr:hypothetical protein LQF76_09310 [Gloeomargaritales cyanobacterium VI4D9]
MGVIEDQQGAGFPRIMFITVDIGAFEVQTISPVVPPPAPVTFVLVEVLYFSNQLNIILRGTEDVIFSQLLPCAPKENFEQCLDDVILTSGETHKC